MYIGVQKQRISCERKPPHFGTRNELKLWIIVSQSSSLFFLNFVELGTRETSQGNDAKQASLHFSYFELEP